MLPNVVLGLLLIIFAGWHWRNIVFLILGLIWLIAPLIMYKLSIKNEKSLSQKISQNDKEFLLDKARYLKMTKNFY